MASFPIKLAVLTGAVVLALCGRGGAQEQFQQPPCEVLISVPDQRLAVVCNGEYVARYPISTSRFGTGDSMGSYRTPLGQLRVSDKIGEDLPAGAVIKHRSATGEVIPANAPGRDPIVTRVVWLDGLEEQNRNAHSRGIYIHGTPDEKNLGHPASYGCIRMRSEDVIQLCQQIPVGAMVSILSDKLPHMRRYDLRKEEIAWEKRMQEAAPKPVPASAAPMIAAARPPAIPKPVETMKIPEAVPLAPIAEHIEKSKLSFANVEHAERSSSSALAAMKGSILLANLPDPGAPLGGKFATSTSIPR